MTDQTVLLLANTVDAKLQISHGISDAYIEEEEKSGSGKIHRRIVEPFPQQQKTAY